MQPLETGAIQMARLDPRTTRLKYRLERLMLTPLFRFTLRVVLPVALTVGAAAAWFAVEANRTAVTTLLADIRHEFESRPEFQVRLMAIDGASDGVAEDIREILPLDFPVSSFDLDLAQMQALVTELDAVKRAQLRIRQGGVLQIDVEERVPALLWRHADGLSLMDAGGVHVGPATERAAHAALPVIAGEAAEQAVPEALALDAAASPLRGRVRGYERMGARRWDVVLDRGQRILLPETGAVQAFERVIAMDQAVQLLDRDVVAVDLRLPHRPTVRLTASAVEALTAFKEIEAGGVEKP